MKIEIEIPDWADERHIYIMAGIELAAYKYAGESWKVKTGRCNSCGECCMCFRENTLFHKKVINGKCIHLKQNGEQFVCDLGEDRPFSCCVVIRPKNRPNCTEMFD